MRRCPQLPSSQSILPSPSAPQSLLDNCIGNEVRLIGEMLFKPALPVALSLWVSAAHHIVRDSGRAVSRHQTLVLRPNGNDDGSEGLRSWRTLRKPPPSSHERQLVGVVMLRFAGQASRRDARAVKHRRFQFQKCDVVVERENVEIFVRNDFLNSLDLGVIPRNVVAANESLK